MFGDDGEEVTPVPIPNTEVKLFSADGSWGSPPVRVGRRQASERPANCWSFFIMLHLCRLNKLSGRHTRIGHLHHTLL